jgi:hypothetical protein
MASSSSKKIMHKELNRINNFVWKTMKCIVPLFEEEEESDTKFFYTPLQSPSKLVFASTKDRKMVDCGIRHFRILLKYDERIVDQLTLEQCGFPYPHLKYGSTYATNKSSCDWSSATKPSNN